MLCVEGGKIVLVEHGLGQRVRRAVKPTRITSRIDNTLRFTPAQHRHDLGGVDTDGDDGARPDIGTAPKSMASGESLADSKLVVLHAHAAI